jgi:hypothetical protein
MPVCGKKNATVARGVFCLKHATNRQTGGDRASRHPVPTPRRAAQKKNATAKPWRQDPF